MLLRRACPLLSNLCTFCQRQSQFITHMDRARHYDKSLLSVPLFNDSLPVTRCRELSLCSKAVYFPHHSPSHFTCEFQGAQLMSWAFNPMTPENPVSYWCLSKFSRCLSSNSAMSGCCVSSKKAYLFLQWYLVTVCLLFFLPQYYCQS